MVLRQRNSDIPLVESLGAATWHRVRAVALKDAAVHYALEPGAIKPFDLRDGRGRLAVEAYLALPLDVIAAEAEHRGDPAPRTVELLRFLETFGPVGFEWGQVFPVSKVEVQARLLPQSGRGRVEAHLEPLDEHAYDRLADLRFVRSSLLRSVQLAEAVASGEVASARAAWANAYPEDFGVSGPRWEPALQGARRRGTWYPLRPGVRPDWVVLARIGLADQLTRVLRFSEAVIDVGRGGQITQSWQFKSLVDVMYWQLFEQVRDRQQFGVGHCSVCGGPILRTRDPARGRANQWHKGCASAGRQRRSRAHRKESAS